MFARVHAAAATLAGCLLVACAGAPGAPAGRDAAAAGGGASATVDASARGGEGGAPSTTGNAGAGGSGGSGGFAGAAGDRQQDAAAAGGSAGVAGSGQAGGADAGGTLGMAGASGATGGLGGAGATGRGGAGPAGRGGATGGAGAGGNAVGGAGGTSAGTYAPCPPLPAVCKIMPSGDSITVGAQSTDTGGYRAPLFHLLLQNKKSATFVGPSGAGPANVDGVPFPDAHDGHSGYIIDTIETRKGLLPLMAANLQKHTPNIVLLMIGTNDVNTQLDLPNAPSRLAALIDLVTTTAPDALLVVAQLTPTRTDSLNADVRAFNATIPALVAERARAGKHIVAVDMYGAFTANASYKTQLLFDGLHPNDAGYAEMAKVWYAAIGGVVRATGP